MTNVANAGYRGPQVCDLVGITYRMLDYWARTDLVRPSISEARGSGTQRRYSAGDVFRLRVVKQLLDAGISLQSIRGALPLVDPPVDEDRRWLVIGGGPPMVCRGDELAELLGRRHLGTVLDLAADVVALPESAA